MVEDTWVIALVSSSQQKGSRLDLMEQLLIAARQPGPDLRILGPTRQRQARCRAQCRI
ncbi:hypothetical protein [Kribbella sp. VKM Ac-2566]|uniref:hypothetical protein n=1 Tax=Kribbella sp. VKM Ac-2566 TaxID=2512218 RepID=UPI0014170F3A|nr:hypothetical protein [Kribbella sp. VKM Ac-2566]